MQDLEGRVALVSGGGRGAGRGISLRLAQAGADVAILYRRDEGSAAATVDQLLKSGVRARSYQASVDHIDDDRRAVAAVVEDFGHVDILVNNAGRMGRGHTIAETDPAEPERLMRTNTFGALYLSQLVLPSMRARARGDIVMISSTAATRLDPHNGPYSMTKAALEALALTLAREEARHGVHVNVVAPGLFVSDMGRRLISSTLAMDITELADAFPLGRLCQPEDIGDLVVYLCSRESSYLTGQRVVLDGGADPVAFAAWAAAHGRTPSVG